MSTVNFAGIIVDNVTLAEASAKAEEFIHSNTAHLIVTPNPELIVTCQDDAELKNILNSADLRVPDGISMVVVSKILRHPLKERVSGIDLMLKIMETAGKKGFKVFLLGGEPGIAEEAAGKLIEKYPGVTIVGTGNGYFKDDAPVIEKIKNTKPDLLFVGLGGGRQEKWLSKHLKTLNVPAAMVIGGSLDVISERKKRAPVWAQKMYIEWLYRLVTEPKRWKRQLALPKFLYLTLIKKMV